MIALGFPPALRKPWKKRFAAEDPDGIPATWLNKVANIDRIQSDIGRFFH
jgi:hypothetical protein